MANLAELIKRRRRQIMVHSALYYRLNENIISDEVYDNWCEELVELQKKNPFASRLAPLHEAFKDFDGSTGFNLPIGDPYWLGLANSLLNSYRHSLRGDSIS